MVIAKRIGSYADLDVQSMCYWRTDGEWVLYIPRCGVGRLAMHQIEEHSDGTITVSPSIKMEGHDNGMRTIRHGFLARGVWTEA